MPDDTRSRQPYQQLEQFDSPLKSLLMEIVPENENGAKTMSHLAEKLNRSRQGLRRWLTNQRIPAECVPLLIEISKEGGRPAVDVRRFDPFVYGTSTTEG